MTEQLKQQIIETSRLGQQVCEKIERGQADTPLTEYFSQIEAAIDNDPFSIVLLGLTTDARSSVLSWLYGNDFSVISFNVIEQLGLVEINLRDKGYTFEKVGESKLEFDRLDAFVDALKNLDFVDPDAKAPWLDPISLGVNSEKGIQGIKVYMPESPEFILTKPGLLNRIVSQSNLLVIAAPLHHTLNETEQQAINELNQNMDAFWPLLTVDELADDITPPSVGWWEQGPSSIVQLAPQLLTTHKDATIPKLLQDIDDETRQSLSLYFQLQKMVQATETIEERNQQEIKRLNNRKNREQRKSKNNDDATKSVTAIRHEWENAKQLVNDQFAQLAKSTQKISKQALLSEGKLFTQLEQYIGQLSTKELNQEPGHKSVKITVEKAFVEQLQNGLKAIVKKEFTQELVNTNANLTNNLHQITQKVDAITHKNNKISVENAQEKQLWRSLSPLFSLNIRYRGEIPKRGFMQRLSDGRKAIMGISMMAMVIGGVFKAVWGIDFRAMVMLVAPLIFLGAVGYSYFVWPKEDAERFAKELDRVKDGLSSEIKKLLNEVHREKQATVNEYLEQQKKQVLRQIDNLAREHQVNADQEQEQHQQLARQKLQHIDQQLVDQQGFSREISQLMRKCETLLRDGKKALSKLSNV